jgi:P27 family predicted phage terminase small subunit
MARIPRPTVIKKLLGDPNKERLNLNEPVPPPGKTTCPSSLKGAARSEWRRIYPILEAMQLITPADRTMLAAYCIAWGTIVDTQKQLNKLQDKAIAEGKDITSAYLIKTSEGAKTSPLMAIRAKALEQLNQFGAKFGLTPSDRSRIEMPEQTKEDELDEFLKTGKMN